MNGERTVSKASRIELDHLVRIGFRHCWGAVTVLTVGLILSILASSVLPMGNVSTAPPRDVPCTLCADASDPVQYTSLAALAAAERDASVSARAAQYTSLAALYGAKERANIESGAARWSAIAEHFALGSDRGSVASAARYSGLAAHQGRTLDAGSSAIAARMEALADSYAVSNADGSIR